MKVIGVGFGRTGTLSLKTALERLGAGPCFHMLDLMFGEDRDRDLPYWTRIAGGERVDLREVFAPWQSTVDWPACTLWRELVDAFPEATVLLNVRDFDAFYTSCRNTLLAVKRAALAGELAPDAQRVAVVPDMWRVIEKLVWQGDFQGRFEDKEWVRGMYHDRIEQIKAYVPADRLVVWTLGVDGWAPLADALGVPAPDDPFPHLHDTNEFRLACGLPPLPARPEQAVASTPG
jgi:hypothetical protein